MTKVTTGRSSQDSAKVGAVANPLPDRIEVSKVALAYIFSIHRNQDDSLRLLLGAV